MPDRPRRSAGVLFVDLPRTAAAAVCLFVAGVLGVTLVCGQTVAGGQTSVRWAPTTSSGSNPGSAPFPSGNATGSGSSVLNRLRSAASRMEPEEVPPPRAMPPAPNDAGQARDQAAAPGKPVRIPVASSAPDERVEIRQSGGQISLTARAVPLNQLVMLLGQQLGINIVCADTVSMPVSLTVERVSLEDALSAVCSISGCCWAESNGIIHITSTSATSKVPADVQGRQLKVFRLDFSSARDMDAAVKGLLSPVGQSFTTEAKNTDNRRTQEVLVVQDLPGNLRSIEQYVAQVDRPPRQVMIEAHILSIDLSSGLEHGVDFKYLFAHLAQANLQVGNIPKTLATNPAGQFLFTFDGTHFDMIVKALSSQAATKTLGSPKLLVLDGQEARIQMGKQLGYYVQTTTETSTTQSVNFLDVGTILRVTPRISADNQILMRVRPEVSDGDVIEGLPRSTTTEVETDVMLPDGRGMVLGGLIDEKDTENQEKVPLLGDLWLVGRIFQKRTVSRERHEVIICLLPRIVPCALADNDRHALEVERGRTPLVFPDLKRYPRPWEGQLPDAVENPWLLREHLPSPQRREERRQMQPGDPAEAHPYYAGQPPYQGVPMPWPPSASPAPQPPSNAVRPTSYEPEGDRPETPRSRAAAPLPGASPVKHARFDQPAAAPLRYVVPLSEKMMRDER